MEDKLNLYFGLVISMAAFAVIAAGFIVIFIRYQKKTLASQRMLHELDLKHKKDLISSSIRSSEDERTRIAKDIHDEIGGIFSALSLSLNQLSAGDSSPAAERIDQSKKLVRSGAESVRRISRAIVPFDLELFGLRRAIENHLDTISSVSAIDTRFEAGCDLELLPKDAALSVYRILQELTSNTLKYAEATMLSVTFGYDASSGIFTMSYNDNGKGFDSEPAGTMKGIGLKNIESRAIALNASLGIASAPGKGMTCSISIPSTTLLAQ